MDDENLGGRGLSNVAVCVGSYTIPAFGATFRKFRAIERRTPWTKSRALSTRLVSRPSGFYQQERWCLFPPSEEAYLLPGRTTKSRSTLILQHSSRTAFFPPPTCGALGELNDTIRSARKVARCVNVPPFSREVSSQSSSRPLRLDQASQGMSEKSSVICRVLFGTAWGQGPISSADWQNTGRHWSALGADQGYKLYERFAGESIGFCSVTTPWPRNLPQFYSRPTWSKISGVVCVWEPGCLGRPPLGSPSIQARC